MGFHLKKSVSVSPICVIRVQNTRHKMITFGLPKNPAVILARLYPAAWFLAN
jgi:hypothetical protein